MNALTLNSPNKWSTVLTALQRSTVWVGPGAQPSYVGAIHVPKFRALIRSVRVRNQSSLRASAFLRRQHFNRAGNQWIDTVFNISLLV
jgi:hypothetical protein